jgi:hypothetical protein
MAIKKTVKRRTVIVDLDIFNEILRAFGQAPVNPQFEAQYVVDDRSSFGQNLRNLAIDLRKFRIELNSKLQIWAYDFSPLSIESIAHIINATSQIREPPSFEKLVTDIFARLKGFGQMIPAVRLESYHDQFKATLMGNKVKQLMPLPPRMGGGYRDADTESDSEYVDMDSTYGDSITNALTKLKLPIESSK